MKRVLIVHHSSKISGAEKSLIDYIEIACRLKFHNFRFHFVCPRGDLYTKLCYYDVVLDTLPLKRLKRTKNILKLARDVIHIGFINAKMYYFLLKNKIDLVHANTSTSACYSILAVKLLNIPFIWHVRDIRESYL